MSCPGHPTHQQQPLCSDAALGTPCTGRERVWLLQDLQLDESDKSAAAKMNDLVCEGAQASHGAAKGLEQPQAGKEENSQKLWPRPSRQHTCCVSSAAQPWAPQPPCLACVLPLQGQPETPQRKVAELGRSSSGSPLSLGTGTPASQPTTGTSTHLALAPQLLLPSVAAVGGCVSAGTFIS